MKIPGRTELPCNWRHEHHAFVDPSGGSGTDSMTLAISHMEGGKAVLDLVREAKPPFSPEIIVRQFCQLLEAYRISQVVGDRYAGRWLRKIRLRH